MSKDSELFNLSCPYCHSKVIHPTEVHSNERGVFTRFGCHSCLSMWESRIAPPSGLKENILTGIAVQLKAELTESEQEKSELLRVLERVGKWYKANGVRYDIAEDVWAILHKYGVDINE